jgi:N-acetylneuraminic acid mutarotase
MNRIILVLLLFVSISYAQIPETGCWLSGAPLPTPRQELQLVQLNGLIYVIGGIDVTMVASNVVEVYNPATDSWTTAAPLPLTMHHLSTAVVNGKIYVLGGYHPGFQAVNNVFEYDPAMNQWTEKAPMLQARGAATASVVNGKIYVIGGVHTPGGPTGANEVYDPVADTWQALAPMPAAREHLSSASDGTFIYVAGGRNGSGNSNRFEAYDPVLNTWTSLSNLPTARSGLAAAHMDGKIYVLGGEIPGVYEENEEYDIAAGTWKRVADMTTPRHGIGSAVLNGAIYIIGGGPQQGFGVSARNEKFTLVGTPFSEEFDNPALPGWQVLKGTWIASTGYLTGTHHRKGTITSENAACSCCSFETFIRVDTNDARCSLLAFYQDKRNLVELILMPDRGKWSLRHRVAGRLAAKSSVRMPIIVSQDYHIQMEYTGTNLQVMIDNVPVFDIPIQNPGSGQVGFRVKSTNGLPASCSIEEIRID